MKKIIALLCAVTLSLSMAACGSTGGNNNADSNSAGLASADTLSAGGEISGEITVSCYDTVRYKNFLEEAVKLFEEEYPKTKVNIETFSAMPEVKTQEQDGKRISIVTQGDDSQSQLDYVNKINTELMSGKGADIIALDILPFYKYANNGQLENLQEYIDNDSSFNKDDYRTNIFDAVTDDKGQYIFPIDYSFNYFAYDSSLLSESEQSPLQSAETLSYEQLIETGKDPFEAVNKNSSETIHMFGLNDGARQRPNMFSELFSENYSSFIDVKAKKANFTDGMFADLLNSIKDYSAEGYIKKATTSNEPMTPDMMEKTRDEKYFFKSKNSMSLMGELNKNAGRRMMMAGSGNTENDKISGLLTNDKGEIPFTFTQAYGINSNSKNKQAAWAFIKFLGSEKMQTSMNLMGLPINTNAFLERSKMEITGELFMPENAGKELDESGKAIYDNYVSLVNRYTSLINTYFIKDATISNLVETEVQHFFDGTKSAEEVADVLQNKISLYLNE